MSSHTEDSRIEQVFDLLLGTPPERWDEVARTECAGYEGLAEEVLTLLRAAPTGEAYLSELAQRLGLPTSADRPDGLLGRRVGPYTLKELLGRGGMGSVYLAERDEGDFRVRAAVKLVTTGLLSPAGQERFLSERRILSGLDHPHIARLFDGGFTDDGTPYFVMEYVDGSPVDVYCDRLHLSLRARIELFLDICAAVRHAHEKLVIHRDLKPENVLVSAGGTVKLLDFGIARAMDAAATGIHTMTAQPHPMTYAYASPEQVKGEALTTASDVYQLGVLLYRLLTGRHPYARPSGSLAEAERNVLERSPTDPGRVVDRPLEGVEGREVGGLSAEEVAVRRATTLPRLRKELSGDLGLIMLTALRKDPERRYRAVAELVDDLERYLDGLTISARPLSRGYRLQRFVGRHRKSVAALGTIGVLLTAIVALGVNYALDTRAQAARIALESATTAEVFDFLLDILTLADPTEGGGDTLTVRAALERGVRNQRDRLVDRPELRSRLLQTMADAYGGLGLDQEATPLLIEAAALHDETGTLADTALAGALIATGASYRARGQEEDAMRQYERALEVIEAIGADSLWFADVFSRMSNVLSDMGEVDSARVLGGRSLDVVSRLLGEDHSRTLKAASSYATVLWASGEQDSAIVLVRDVVQRAESLEEPDGGISAGALNNLGVYLRRTGDLKGAEESYRRALGDFGQWMPLSQRQTAMVNLASTLDTQGDTAGALEVLREHVALAREAWPDGHWRVGNAHYTLGRAYIKFGYLADAEAPLREGIAGFSATIGPEHAWTANAESILGAVLGTLGRPAEAEPYLLAAYQKLLATQGPEGRWVVDAAGRLADFYETQGRVGEAAPFRALLRGAG